MDSSDSRDSSQEPVTVEHNQAEGRFETRVGDHLALAAYRLSGDAIIFTHTEVPDALQGRGIANHLARTALEYARSHNLAVVPLCPFFASYIRKHPEYQPLVRDNQ